MKNPESYFCIQWYGVLATGRSSQEVLIENMKVHQTYHANLTKQIEEEKKQIARSIFPSIYPSS